MNGLHLLSSAEVTAPALGSGWRLAAVADVNRDGHTDFVWQHDTSGQLALWVLSRLSLVLSETITPSVPCSRITR